MKTFLLSALFFSFVLTGYSQEFVNKITGVQSGSKSIKHSLDYIENEEDENGNPVTTIYVRHIPVNPSTDYDDVADWSTIYLVDKKTGKRYKVIDGNFIPLTLKSAFSFYNRGGEIGFTLTFERLPASVRNIDIISQEVVWFKNVAIDPERDDDDNFFRFNYFFKSLLFFASVPGTTVFFTMDGYFKNDLYIKQHYSNGNRPKGCGAEGIMIFAYPHSFDKEVSIKAESYTDGQLRSTWNLKRKPSVNTCANFINLNKG